MSGAVSGILGAVNTSFDAAALLKDQQQQSIKVKGEKKFRDLLNPGQAKTRGGFGFEFQRDLKELQNDIVAGKKIDAKKLLYYQIRVGSYALKVELASKTAEAATSTVRRFEQAQ